MSSAESAAAKSPAGRIRVLEIRTSRRTELAHTTAGIIVNENDDPDVARDLEAALDRMVPKAGPYQHAEGNADSHIKSALAGASETLFIEEGRLALGRWQGIFFCEFDGPRRRQVHVKIVPDPA